MFLIFTDIHYFHCVQIIEILKTTEADTKSVFGRYGSQRMKDWQEIVHLYEKDSVYLAESAQLLIRNVNYELPSVKKQISKFDQLIDESQKKIQDLTSTETVLLSQRAALCQKLGIDGKHLREEFTARVKELPKLYAEIALATKKLDQGLQLYSTNSKNHECLPIVRYLIEKGNTTVYEYSHNEAPLSVEEPPIDLKLTVDSVGASSNEIDFGDGDINFGNDVQLEVGDINWGEDDNGAADEINFDVSLEDSGIKVESSGLDGGVARNDEALTILDAPSYRDQFLDEIFELESFLKMRHFELNSLENSNSASFMLLDNLDSYTADSIAAILIDVQNVIEKSTSELIQHLHHLKHSEK